MVDANEVNHRSVDWRRETILADHVLSQEGQNIDLAQGIFEEELVSPSIHSDGGRGCRTHDL